MKGPTLLGPGEAGSFTVEVTNISLGVYAGGVDSLGDVEVQFTILEPDGSFSFRAPPPQGGNDQPEVVVDDAGVTATVAVPLMAPAFSNAASPRSRYAFVSTVVPDSACVS